jgi:hypothetical protein
MLEFYKGDDEHENEDDFPTSEFRLKRHRISAWCHGLAHEDHHSTRVDPQEFKDFGICDLRFGVGLVGINHVMGDTKSRGKFVK